MDPRIKALVASVARKKAVDGSGTAPTYTEVHAYLKGAFPGAEQFASAFYNAMTKQHWLDRNRQPLTNWRRAARKYASVAHLRQ